MTLVRLFLKAKKGLSLYFLMQSAEQAAGSSNGLAVASVVEIWEENIYWWGVWLGRHIC